MPKYISFESTLYISTSDSHLLLSALIRPLLSRLAVCSWRASAAASARTSCKYREDSRRSGGMLHGRQIYRRNQRCCTEQSCSTSHEPPSFFYQETIGETPTVCNIPILIIGFCTHAYASCTHPFKQLYLSH